MKSTLALELKSKVDNHLDLWKIEFVPPFYYVDGNQKWNIPKALRTLSSIIIFKSKNVITSIHYCRTGIHQRMFDLVYGRMKNLNIDSIAVVPMPEHALEHACKLYKFQKAFTEQQCLSTTIFELLQNPCVTQSDILSVLDFKNPFIDHKAKRRKYTFSRKPYVYLSGVYVVLVNRSIVYYVGQSHSLYKRFYAHFADTSGVVKDRPDKEVAKFNDLFSQYEVVEAAFIDVPMLKTDAHGNTFMRSKSDIQEDLTNLERELTILLKPLHVHGYNQEPFVHSPPSDEPAPF